MRTRMLVALVLAAVANTTAASAASNVNREAAAQLYKLGVEANAAERFAEAAGLFERAYVLDPSPPLLWNAAAAHESDGNYILARARYQELLTRKDVAADQRTQAEQRVTMLAARIARGEGKPGPLNPPPLVPNAPPAAPTTTPTPPPTRVTPIPPAPAAQPLAPAPVPPSPAPTAVRTVPTPAAPAAPSDGPIASKRMVLNGGPDAERPIAVAAMTCRWNGPTGRFDSCSTTHAWGGNANFDLTPGRTRAARNMLTLTFVDRFHRRPYCSVDFSDIIVNRRIDTHEANMTVYLHDTMGRDLNWQSVSSWVSILCVGVK